MDRRRNSRRECCTLLAAGRGFPQRLRPFPARACLPVLLIPQRTDHMAPYECVFVVYYVNKRNTQALVALSVQCWTLSQYHHDMKTKSEYCSVESLADFCRSPCILSAVRAVLTCPAAAAPWCAPPAPGPCQSPHRPACQAPQAPGNTCSSLHSIALAPDAAKDGIRVKMI